MSWLDKYFTTGIHGVAADGVGLEAQPTIDFGDGLTAVSDPNSGTITVTADATTATTGTLFAALRTEAATASPGQKLWLKGYSTPGDGGEGTFTVLDGGPFTDDGGTIAVPGGGSGSRCASRDYAGPLDPAWFGAVGDGTTDDTAAIQRATASLQARGGGGLMFTKPHAIFVSSHATPLGNFSNCNGISLLCRGGSLILPAIEWALLGFWPCFSFNGCHNITVDGFECTGGTLDHATNVVSGVSLVDFFQMTAPGSNLMMPHNRLSGAWSGMRLNQAYTEDGSNRMRKIQVGYLEVTGGTYGINGRYSGDDMSIGMLRTQDTFRSLFMVGVSNIRAYVDSADHHGSHDVWIVAQENWSVENVHIHYVRNRDTGSGTADNLGVEFAFFNLHNTSPPKFNNCSTYLDVSLPPAGTNSLINAAVLAKIGADLVTPDPTDRGYTVHDFSISGRVDMNDRGGQAVLLSDPFSWGSGEFASNIDLSDLAVFNSVATLPAIWFPIVRSLVGPMKLHNTRVDSDRDINIFNSIPGGARYSPPAGGLVSVRAVQCANRFDHSGGSVDSYSIHQGDAIERVGGWSGVSLYKDATQVGSLAVAAGDYLAFGVTPATTGYLRGPAAFPIYFRKADNSANLKLIEADGGNNVIVGNISTAGTYVDASSSGVFLRSNAKAMVSAVSGTGVTLKDGNEDARLLCDTTAVKFYAGVTQLGQIGNGSGDFIRIGATPATAGGLRVAKDFAAYFRKADNSADIKLIEADGSNNVIVGAITTAGTFVDASTGGAFLRSNGQAMVSAVSGTGVTLKDGAGDARLLADTSALKFYAGVTQLGALGAASGDFIRIGVTPATAGYLRTPNDFNIYFRKADNSADLKMIEVDGGNNVIVGASGIAGAFVDSGSGGTNLRSGGQLMFKCTSTAIGVFNTTPAAQQPGGSATAGGTYGATEQTMLQKVYDAMRAFGWMA
jgi:hypothetical protein